jgi:uncharacterized protein
METYTAIQNPQPVQQADRIQTVDMIRGFALLGILLMNIPGFGINWDFWYKALSGSQHTKDFYTLAIIETFFDGTMRGLFSMLFGAGMILFTLNKKEVLGGPTITEYYYRRLLWLVLFGVFNAFVLLWFGDILFFYGLCGMVLYVFRKTNPKWLLVLGFVCMSITMLKNQWQWNETTDKRKAYTEAVKLEKQKQKLSPEQTAAKAEWQEIEKRRKPDTSFTNKNLRMMRSGYTTVFRYWVPMNAEDETWGIYHQWGWDGLTMMFIGMALFGLGFFSNKFSTSTYTMLLLVSYGIGIPIGWLAFKEGAVMSTIDFGNYADRFTVNHRLLYDVRRILLSVGHASLLLLIYRSRIAPWLMRALTNVGQMAFTNYLMQSIICTWFFYGYGFGMYDKLSYYQLYYVVFAVWIFQLIASSIWLRYFKFGPFEWLWRSLTYWKAQPMKR